ncbi:hypothetical protein EDD21DRAFT_350194 [Dissophora ornata]|nr:hypothetical protein EDD21DRAFT_350194 [Dissophora ornata]
MSIGLLARIVISYIIFTRMLVGNCHRSESVGVICITAIVNVGIRAVWLALGELSDDEQRYESWFHSLPIRTKFMRVLFWFFGWGSFSFPSSFRESLTFTKA